MIQNPFFSHKHIHLINKKEVWPKHKELQLMAKHPECVELTNDNNYYDSNDHAQYYHHLQLVFNKP